MQRPSHLLPCILTSILLLSPLAIATHPHPTSDPPTITLDCTALNGTITPYGQINDGPIPVRTATGYADLTAQYHAIGITNIRTHDLNGPTDIHTIFPNLSRDPTDPANYNFTTSDTAITSMITAGAHVYYRLGESATTNTSLRLPPTNYTTWAQVCLHITMHYNDGWDHGYHDNITDWEIWNEPDITPFWNGTPTQYYTLYTLTATTLKNYNHSLHIGGPTTSNPYNHNFTDAFLTYLHNTSAPLDFFSWHSYASSPQDYYNTSTHIRSLLDTYNFTHTQNINSEWNYNILSPQRDKDNAKNTAFTASTLTIFQDAHLDQAYRYRGTQDNNWLMRLIGFDLALFTENGTYKRPALAYQLLHTITTDTPQRIQTPPQNGSTGITYLAGLSPDHTNLSIMITNYNTKNTDETLALTNLPFTQPYTITHYLIDETHHLQIINQTTSNASTLRIPTTLKTNSVHFYRLTTSTALPPEGPTVAKIPLLLRLKILDPFTFILAIWVFLKTLG